MGPYRRDDINTKNSKVIADPKEIIKLKLASEFNKIAQKMMTDEVLNHTKLDKSDLSRIKTLNLSRFTIDGVVSLLSALGYQTEVKVKKSQAS